jgi:hypothetical protein
VTVEGGLLDPTSGLPFPFGATPTLSSLEGLSQPQRLLLAMADDRVFMFDTQTDLLYQVDPFTGEIRRLTRLHTPNLGAWEEPGEDFDGDGIPNEVDLCPEHWRICDGGPNPGRSCGIDADCSDETSSGTCVVVTQDDLDEDGVGDACDNCPNIPNPRLAEFDRPFFRTTTGGQLDSDADGIGDLCDCDFTANGTLCALTDLEHMARSTGERIDAGDGCPDRDGAPGFCSRYDLDGGGFLVSAGDILRSVTAMGTTPERCPACPGRCSGPGCFSGRLFADAMTWDPIGGPVWNTPTEFESIPRLFFAGGRPTEVPGLFAAHTEGDRRFIYYPYGILSEEAFGLAFDPYPKNPGETERKTLYGINTRFIDETEELFFVVFFRVPIELIDFQVTDLGVPLPVNQPVDAVDFEPVLSFEPPIDPQPTVTDDVERCSSVQIVLDTESCDPEDQFEVFFWIDDRCVKRSGCTCSGDDCARFHATLDDCYMEQRPCAAYCDEFDVGSEVSCDPELELSGFVWDGTACVPFGGCCTGPDCEAVFPDEEACETAFLLPRDADTEPYPDAPCPNFYHRPACEPDAAPKACGTGDTPADGYFWNGFRCEPRTDFCCEGNDCDDAFFTYDPLPPNVTNPEVALFFARAECQERHVRCPGFCEVQSSVRPTTDPADCFPQEIFVHGWMLDFVSDTAGFRRECVSVVGCCTGPDCEGIATLDPSTAANTLIQCFDDQAICFGFVDDFPLPLSLTFENAGAEGGRLIATTPDGYLMCINPAFRFDFSSVPFSAVHTTIPEKTLRRTVFFANFDVNADRVVDIDDVCAVEAAVSGGAGPCEPTGTGDSLAGACLPFPGGDCSSTPDLNRDARVDEADLALVERRVGTKCDGTAIP